jgi:hypothetical protein
VAAVNRDISYSDDSTESNNAFKERSSRRAHLEVPKMVGAYRYEAAKPLFTNRPAGDTIAARLAALTDQHQQQTRRDQWRRTNGLGDQP